MEAFDYEEFYAYRVAPATPEYYLEHKSGLRLGPFASDIDAWSWLTGQPWSIGWVPTDWNLYQRTWQAETVDGAL